MQTSSVTLLHEKFTFAPSEQRETHMARTLYAHRTHLSNQCWGVRTVMMCCFAMYWTVERRGSVHSRAVLLFYLDGES